MPPRARSTLGAIAVLAALAAWASACVVVGPVTVTRFAGAPGAGLGTELGASPLGIARRGADLYIADARHNVVRRLDLSTGVASIVAGTGTNASTGDGGPALAAELEWPLDVATGPDGSIYIAERRRIRKVDPSGVITTVVGGGSNNADGVPASTSTEYPTSVIVDGQGTVYFLTTENGPELRRVDASGTLHWMQDLDQPRDLAVDATGNIYVADLNRVWRVTPANVKTSYTGGAAGYNGDGQHRLLTRYHEVTAVTIAPDGTMLIGDRVNGRVRRISGGIVTTVAGVGSDLNLRPADGHGDGGPATSAWVESISGLAAGDDGVIHVAENADTTSASGGRHRRVRAFTVAGTIQTVLGADASSGYGDGGPATLAQVAPGGLALDAAGNVLVADTEGHRIRRIAPDGVITTFAGTGVQGDTGDGGPATAARISGPEDVAVDPAGNVYFTTLFSGIKKVDVSGVISTVSTWGVDGLGVDGAGNVYFSSGKLWKLSPGGTPVQWGSLHAGYFCCTHSTFALPGPLQVLPDGTVYVANGSIVEQVDPTGTTTRVAGHLLTSDPNGGPSTGTGGPALEASFGKITGLARGDDGTLYVAEGNNHLIRRVAPNGLVLAFAGTGQKGGAGDGGPAANATFNPGALALGPGGKVYVAEPHNRRIRLLQIAR